MKKSLYEELTSRFEDTGELPLPPGKNEPLTEPRNPENILSERHGGK